MANFIAEACRTRECFDQRTQKNTVFVSKLILVKNFLKEIVQPAPEVCVLWKTEDSKGSIFPYNRTLAYDRKRLKISSVFIPALRVNLEGLNQVIIFTIQLSTY